MREGGRDPGRRLDPGEIAAPGLAGGFLILALQPGEVILEGRLPRQGVGIAMIAVERQHILQQDGARPAVAQQVVLREQQPMALRTQAQQSGADQRRLVQHEAGASVLGLDLAGAPVAFVRIERAEIVLPPGHGAACMNHLQRLSEAVLLETGTQAGVALQQGVEGAAQARGIERALEFKGELDEVGILTLTIEVRVEQQAFLERGQGPDVLEAGMLLLERFDFCLVERDEIEIAGREAAGLGLGGVAGEGFERVAPGVGEAIGVGLADQRWGEAPGGAEDGAGGGVVGDRVEGNRMVERAGFCWHLPVGAIARGETAEIIERDFGRGMPLQYGGALGIEIAQHAVADTIAGNSA